MEVEKRLHTWKKICAEESRDEDNVIQNSGYPFWEKGERDDGDVL